ncbi:MAG: hypothetical protein GY877_09910, partial [Hyphomicrobium sp.]|nr:hypothetical protein [Hyphomicrobium sp.]
MDAFQTAAIVLVGGTAGWVYLKLKERIEFLEHEVRWLRNELEALKPTETESEYDLRAPRTMALLALWVPAARRQARLRCWSAAFAAAFALPSSRLATPWTQL